MERILEALNFAVAKHGSQKRRHKETPYISHPLSVGIILSKLTEDEDIIVAGVLHDVLEETDTNIEEVKDKFGPRVAKIVQECSEKDKTKSWRERKQLSLEEIKSMGEEARQVKLADILHNIHDVRKKVDEFGFTFFDNFHASPKEKIEHERRRLIEFKLYANGNPLLSQIEEHLTYLEGILAANK